jgi:mycoredoxin
MGHSVVVYFRPFCPFGIRLRGALMLRRVPFTAVQFRADEAAAARVRARNGGNEISPTVRIGDMYLSNPPASAVVETRRRWIEETGSVANTSSGS